MPDNDTPPYERVTSTERVIIYLKQLLISREHLIMSVPGSNKIFNSLLLEVNHNNGYLLIDSMNRKTGHELFVEKGESFAHAKFHGVEMTFRCDLLEVVVENDQPLYKIRFPAFLNYHQRRSYFRAATSVNDRITVILDVTGVGTESLRLIDLSLGGLKAGITARGPIPFEPGQLIHSCLFTLDGKDIQVEGQIRNMEQGEHDQVIVGVFFIGLTPAQSRIIESFVVRVQREQIQRVKQYL